MNIDKMKAMIWTSYGPPEVLQLREIPVAVPKDTELLIKVKAATVTTGDCEMRVFKIPAFLWLPLRLFLGIRKPRRQILGQEMSGEVVATGSKVTKYQVGDAIFSHTQIGLGAYAEYTVLPEHYGIGIKPQNMTFDEAATITTGGTNALHFLKMGKLKPGDKVLIIGAGGSIGTYGVQLAKSYGAEVTAVDSGPKLQMLKTIGADLVIDYTKEDFRENGEQYDVIFDVITTHAFLHNVSSLKPGGRYLLANPSLIGILQSWWLRLTSSKRALTGVARAGVAEMNTLKELIEDGKLRAVIDKTYDLEDIPAAHHYVESGQKAGNVVIKIDTK